MDCLGSTNSGQFFEWEGPWTFDAYDFYDEEVLATAAIEAIYAEGLSSTSST